MIDKTEFSTVFRTTNRHTHVDGFDIVLDINGEYISVLSPALINQEFTSIEDTIAWIDAMKLVGL